MNKVKKWSVIAIICIVLGLILVGIGIGNGVKGYNFFFDENGFGINFDNTNNEYREKNDKKIFSKKETDSIKNINICLDNGFVKIFEWDKDYVKVQYSMNERRREPNISLKNGLLKMESPGQGISFNFFNFGINNSDKFSANVYVPKKMNIQKMNVEINAGKIESEAKFTINEEFAIDLNAGDVDMRNITSYSSDIEINAGNCSLQGLFLNDVYIDVNAGKIKFDNKVSIDDTSLYLSASSGSITINDVKYGGLDNDYEIENNHSNNELEMDISAGKADVTYEKK